MQDRDRWDDRGRSDDRGRWDDRGRSDNRGRGDDRGRSDNRGRGDDRGRSGGVWPVMASIDHWDDWNDWDNMDHNQDPLMGRQYMDQEMDELPQLDLNPQEDTDWPMIP